MSEIDVREIQKPLRAKYQTDSEAARYTYRVRTVDGAAGDPMHMEAVSALHGNARYRVTINERIGGSGDEPTPGDLLLAALASCQALAVRMVAASLRVPLESLEVEAEGDVDHRGVLLMGGVRPGFEAIRCRVRVRPKEGTPPELMQKLFAAAHRCCAVTDALKNATPLETDYQIA